MKHRLESVNHRGYGFVFTCSCGADTGQPRARADAQTAFGAHLHGYMPLAMLVEECERGWQQIFRSHFQWREQIERRVA